MDLFWWTAIIFLSGSALLFIGWYVYRAFNVRKPDNVDKGFDWTDPIPLEGPEPKLIEVNEGSLARREEVYDIEDWSSSEVRQFIVRKTFTQGGQITANIANNKLFLEILKKPW